MIEQSESIAKLGGYWNGVGPHFLVSDQGQVWSLKSNRLLKLSKSGDGYLTFGDGARGTRKYVHHTVCEIFHGPRPSPAHQACHRDGDKTRNTYDNLVWGTPAENAADKIRHGTDPAGERNGMAKLNKAKVAAMRARREQTAHSFATIAREFGVSTMTAHRAITGKAWK